MPSRLSSLDESLSSILADDFFHANDYLFVINTGMLLVKEKFLLPFLRQWVYWRFDRQDQHIARRHSSACWNNPYRCTSQCQGQPFLHRMVVKGTLPNQRYLKQLRLHYACHQSSLYFPRATNVGHESSQVVPYWMALLVAIWRCSPKLSLRSNCTPRYLMSLLYATLCSPSTIFGYL